MNDIIRQIIIDEIKSAEYYSIVVYRSHNFSHIDQHPSLFVMSKKIIYLQNDFINFFQALGIRLFDSVTKLQFTGGDGL